MLRGWKHGLAALALTAAFASAPSSSQPAQLPTLTIGAAISLSGAQAAEGKLTRQGYEFWREWINDHGGLSVGSRRYRVVISYLDDESNPNLTAQLAARLIDQDHVRFLLGPYGSAEVLAAAGVVERKNIPMVEGAGSSEKIFNQGYRYTFGVMSPARKYLAGMIEFAATRRPKPTTVAILSADDTFSLEAQQGAIALANDHGIHVVYAVRYRSGAVPYQQLAQEIKHSNAEIVLNAGHLGEAVGLQRALAAADVNAKIYGYSVGPDTPEFIQALGPLAEDVLGCAQWSPSVTDVGSPVFVQTSSEYARLFEDRFLHPADYHNATATAAALALQIAIEHAGTLQAARVRDALAAENEHSFFGPIRFDGRGLNIYKQMVVNQIQSGRLITIYPQRFGTAAARFPARPLGGR